MHHGHCQREKPKVLEIAQAHFVPIKEKKWYLWKRRMLQLPVSKTLPAVSGGCISGTDEGSDGSVVHCSESRNFTEGRSGNNWTKRQDERVRRRCCWDSWMESGRYELVQKRCLPHSK